MGVGRRFGISIIIRSRLVACHFPINPRASNGILHPYTGNGGQITPQSIPSYDARERLKISTCGKNWLVWDILFYEMHISCCSRDPLDFKMAANMAEV